MDENRRRRATTQQRNDERTTEFTVSLRTMDGHRSFGSRSGRSEDSLTIRGKFDMKILGEDMGTREADGAGVSLRGGARVASTGRGRVRESHSPVTSRPHSLTVPEAFGATSPRPRPPRSLLRLTRYYKTYK
ncbi:unnamed protein product [Pieris macdunnoughi]|uniref:Uncharacterized protein n=1 Tax=Pieris macdunnoughi TaxID=345717 RepID=A0A821PMN7_9NEOP|nr:unnamed protein product [Pieris macdunnoughi]